MIKLTKTFIISVISIIISSVYAIEIPLEGFGKTTQIAYVNMHRIFESFPETEKARIELNQLIAEKKVEITEKKEDISKLKVEVEFLRKQMTAVEPSTASESVQQEMPEEDETPQTSTETVPASVTQLTLPAGSPLGFIFSPPPTSTQTVSVEESTAPVVAISTSAPQIFADNRFLPYITLGSNLSSFCNHCFRINHSVGTYGNAGTYFDIL